MIPESQYATPEAPKFPTLGLMLKLTYKIELSGSEVVKATNLAEAVVTFMVSHRNHTNRAGRPDTWAV